MLIPTKFPLTPYSGLAPVRQCSCRAYQEKEQKKTCFSAPKSVAVRTGLEPVTPCVTGMYSNQLN